MKRIWIIAVSIVALAVAIVCCAQEHNHAGMADGAMDMHEMHMSAHMHLTELRLAKAADQKRADEVVAAAKAVMAKYADYKAAQADGFQPFLPKLKQKMVHFTNYDYAMEAAARFNPEHPASLLYAPEGNGYKLIGVMYTAPYFFTEEQLNERIPLSVAQWHVHTNLCIPPDGQRWKMLGKNPQFGLNGSISTAEACSEAGGTFHAHIFGWMVHVYPNEADPSQIWSVERQMEHMH